jgi:alpha-galactosidase
MRRRDFLGLAALPLAQALGNDTPADAAAIDSTGTRLSGVRLLRRIDGPFSELRLVNRGRAPVPVKDVVVFDADLHLPAATTIYGEGFQMLSQTGGTIAAPVDFSQYTDEKHYRLPATPGWRTFYGLLTGSPPGGSQSIIGFSSCKRFGGRIQLRDSMVRAIVDTEGLELRAGEEWPLEELMVARGVNRAALLDELTARMSRHHPRGVSAAPPTGWCSWYCFGPSVTAKQVLDNLDTIARDFPSLKYIQIDDGYQNAMGDWLDTGAAFGGNVREVLDAIRRRGFEPAIWVAPFVAEEASAVFKTHPNWFIRGDDGLPMRSDRVTFGGWRRGPWYAIDGTHPEAQEHLSRVFRTMRSEWGCTYFKLDANFWGAMHGGRFHDPRATRIEAYRRGMDAIRRGAGNAFLLGCNHPIWPSLGLVDGSRSSNDIKRSWDRIASTARQNLSRNWQNGRLWWNDSDAVVLAGDLTDSECQFHATAIYASGGMILSGDDLTAIPPERARMLRKLLPPTGVAAQFDGADLRVGTIGLPDARMVALFNWSDAPDKRVVPIDGEAAIVDYWTDESLGRHARTFAVDMAPRSARLLRLTA